MKHLLPTVNKAPALVNVTLVPYGKAKVNGLQSLHQHIYIYFYMYILTGNLNHNVILFCRQTKRLGVFYFPVSMDPMNVMQIKFMLVQYPKSPNQYC